MRLARILLIGVRVRQSKSPADTNRIFREFSNFLDSFRTKPLNVNGNRIVNVGAGVAATDVAIVGQLPRIPNALAPDDQHYEIVWDVGEALNDDQIIPSYIVGKHREGIPVAVYVCTDNSGVPTGDDGLQVNISLNEDDDGLHPILADDLVLEKDEHGPVFGTRFIDPMPKLSTLSRVKPIIVKASGASIVTITLVVKRILNNA